LQVDGATTYGQVKREAFEALEVIGRVE